MKKIILPPQMVALLANGATQIRLPIVPQPSVYHDCTLLWNGAIHPEASYQEPPHVFSQYNEVFDTCYSPFGGPGDLFVVFEETTASKTRDRASGELVHKAYRYKADYINERLDGVMVQFADDLPEEEVDKFQTKADLFKWTPAEDMPRAAARFVFQIESLTTFYVQGITNDEAKLCGLPYATPHRHGLPGIERDLEPRDRYASYHNTGWEDCWICAYREVWNATFKKGEGRWEEDPIVWIVNITRVDNPEIDPALFKGWFDKLMSKVMK